MGRKMKRSWKAPIVLRKIFNDKVQSLLTKLTCMIHQPAMPPFTTCSRCEGRSCLRCCKDPISFLIRPHDPFDYISLLNHCFIVVNEDAPYPNFYPDHRWTQKSLVVRAIEMCQRSKHPNVICYGYNKHTEWSQIVELLTSSAWDILLERVGDECMLYLLQHTTIFVPISDKKHLQAVGSPVKCPYRSKKINKSQSGKKRKQTFGSEFQGSSIHPAEEHKPFSRMPKWKRDKKRRLLNIPECRDKCIKDQKERDESMLSTICFYKDCLLVTVECSCYLMLKAPYKVSNSFEINRQSMFYNLECSSSILPKEHILNTLRPDVAGSKCLMGNIFGLTGAKVSSQSMPCSHNVECCLVGSSCLVCIHTTQNLYGSMFTTELINNARNCSNDIPISVLTIHMYTAEMGKMLIRRARRYNNLKLLNKHCPIPSSDRKSGTVVERSLLDKRGLKRFRDGVAKQNQNTPDTDNTELESTRSYCLKSQVVEFVWAVCRGVVPSDLLGTPSNRRFLKRNISRFIHLRKFEKFSVMQCMYQLKSSDFPFLSNNHNAPVPKNGSESKKFSETNCSVHDIKHKLLFNWILWLFSCLVVPLVQANFYVTEGECEKQDIFYYRKPVWQKFIDHAVTCLKDQSYLELDEAAVRAIICKRQYGFSRLRICPKQTGVRMLANLNKSSQMLQERTSKYRYPWVHKISKPSSRVFKKAPSGVFKYKRVTSVNFELRGIHAVLKGLLLKEPEKLGSTVFDYNDVYKKLRPFITSLKNASTTMSGVFIVAADVSKAFDSVDQEKLLRMMEDVIVKNKYIIERNHQILWSKKYLVNRPSLVWVDETVNPGFANLLSSVKSRSLFGVLVNQEFFTNLPKEQVFSDLYQLLKCNVLQLDKKFYLQKLGIPQGSNLSTMLCSLYYGHMETHVIFPYLDTFSSRCMPFGSLDVRSSSEDAVIFPPTYLLQRFVDDFLFISTSKEQASGFLDMLRGGFPDYNCYMNGGKFCLNFDIEHQSGILSNRVFTGDDGTSFIPWSGLLINSKTLEIQGDYTRYLGRHLNCTLTIRWRKQPGKHLKQKLCDFTRPKCHPIFFDPSINSASVIRLNIYQVFLLCAMKFHCYVSQLSDFFQPRRRYCLKIILESIRYMHRLIEKKMNYAGPSSVLCPDLKHAVMKNEVEWLGLSAYIEVLKKKQTRYKGLLTLLKFKFFAHKITGNESYELRYAVDRSHSSCLWKIKY